MDKKWELKYKTWESKRIVCKVTTQEDWYPTIDGHLKLSVLQAPQLTDPLGKILWTPFIRICIWGGDDFGLEKDYSLDEITFSKAKLEADMIPEPITANWLRAHGFEYC